MAEGITKKVFGHDTYVQSVGVVNDLEIDGFAISVCEEIGVELARHRSRDFQQLEEAGEALSGFDLIVAMSPASPRRALELTRYLHLTVEYWPILDPTGLGESREIKLDAYRQTRDQILKQVQDKWGEG